MKIKRFDRSNTLHGETNIATPLLSIYKDGKVLINKTGMEVLSLNIGDKIAIIQDLDSRKDWFIELNYVTGFKIGKKGSRAAFQSIVLCQEIWKSFGVNPSSQHFDIDKIPKKLMDTTLYHLTLKNLSNNEY